MTFDKLSFLQLPDVPPTEHMGTRNFLLQLSRGLRQLAGQHDAGNRALTVNDIKDILAAMAPSYSTPHGKYVERSSYYSRFLSNGADINMAVDGSTTPVAFSLTVPEGQFYLVNRGILDIRDSGSWAPDGYGSNGALTNGLTGHVEDAAGTIRFNLTEQKDLKTNADWGAFCYDTTLLDWGNAQATKSFSARWTFTKDGAPILMLPGWSLHVQVNDDLSDIELHTLRFGISRGAYPLTDGTS